MGIQNKRQEVALFTVDVECRLSPDLSPETERGKREPLNERIENSHNSRKLTFPTGCLIIFIYISFSFDSTRFSLPFPGPFVTCKVYRKTKQKAKQGENETFCFYPVQPSACKFIYTATDIVLQMCRQSRALNVNQKEMPESAGGL